METLTAVEWFGAAMLVASVWLYGQTAWLWRFLAACACIAGGLAFGVVAYHNAEWGMVTCNAFYVAISCRNLFRS